MRCLFCDKKLSLLKLAKGDSFCSPEHFDAYQLQTSKSDIERLMGLSVGDAPKTPLIIEPRAETPKRDHEEEGLPAPPVVFQPPPYAAFAKPLLTGCPPEASSPVAHEPLANIPDTPLRDPAFPVHDVAGTTGILSLYQQLNPDKIAASNWAPALDPSMIPEECRPGIQRPSLEVSPDLAEIEDQPLGAPVFSAEAASTAKPASPVRQVPVVPPLPFLIAASFMQRTGTPPVLDSAASSIPNSVDLAPKLLHGELTESYARGGVPQSTCFAETGALQLRDGFAHQIEVGSAVPFSPDFVLPGVGAKTHLEGWHVSSRLIGLTSSVVETSYNETTAVNFNPPGPASLMVRPEAILAQSLGLSHIWPEQPPVFSVLAPLAGKASPRRERPRPLEPGRMPFHALAVGMPEKRFIDKGSPVAGVLQKAPTGCEAVFVNPPPCAMEPGCRAVLSQGPVPAPFSTAMWKNQATLYSVRVSIADKAEAPAFPLESLPASPACIKTGADAVPRPSLACIPGRSIGWQEFDSHRPASPRPKPVAARSSLCFSATTAISGKPELVKSSVLRVELQRTFGMPPRVLFAGPDLPSSSSTALPGIVESTRNLKIGLGSPFASWEPHPPVPPHPPAVKLLPVRGGPILPSARSWPRLRALPR